MHIYLSTAPKQWQSLPSKHAYDQIGSWFHGSNASNHDCHALIPSNTLRVDAGLFWHQHQRIAELFPAQCHF